MASARIDAARRVAGELLAPLAHDLRSGLTGILGWAQVLERVTDDATRSRAIEGIRRAVAYQTRLAEDVADAGHTLLVQGDPDVPEDIDVYETMRAAVAGLAESARAREIEFHFVPPDRATTIRANAELVRRLAHLLVTDALQQAPSGGVVMVSVAERDDELVIALGDPAAPAVEADSATEQASVKRRRIAGNVRRVIATLLARIQGGEISRGRSGALQATLPRRSAA